MKSILLVEDESYILDIYSIQLRKEGYKVDIAQDGQVALEKIKNNYPDLLVLDIDLPKINGCEVLQMIRNDPKTKNLKVIILSNYNEKDLNEKYNVDIASLGAIKHFLKVETTVEEISKTIREILK